MIDIQKVIEPKDFEIGVIMARFQVSELHDAHKEMIKLVCDNHKKVIIFLGIARVQNTKRNPMDFATRKAMIQEVFPSVTILPQLGQRDDQVWSDNLDAQIALPFGFKKTLLYGSRDSFIPHYKGVHTTTELTTTSIVSGTDSRDIDSKEILNSKKFRAGIIYANYARRAVTYSTVDVCAYNDKGEILMAKKPNENRWRFVGGFVDRTDNCDETAVRREFQEETGGSLTAEPRYILSHQVDDWRYQQEEDGIMTRLFLVPFGFGRLEANDDIEELNWVPISRYTNPQRIEFEVMEEHQEMLAKLVTKVYTEELIPNLGDFYNNKIEPIDPDVVKPNKYEVKV